MTITLSVSDIAFGIAAAFIAGILAESLRWHVALAVIVLVLAFIAIHYAASLFTWTQILLFVGMFLFGALYTRIYLVRDNRTLTLPFNKEISFSAVIVSEPSESGNYEVFTAEPWHSHAVTVLAPPMSGFHYGDLVKIRGILGAPDDPGGNPFTASPRITFIGAHRGFWLREWLIDFKEAILKIYNRSLSTDQAALLGGITFGGSVGVSAALKAQMEASGTSYILSMYGYKIAVATSLAAALLENFFSRRITFFACIAVIALFVLGAGLIASAVRAGIMAVIALTAREAGRPFNKRNAIVLTAAIMLAVDPLLLVGDIGFQLSCLSIIGITYLQKPLKRLWQYADSGFFDWKDGSVTTIAVLTPMVPLIGNSNGQFPVTSLISNVLLFLVTPVTVFFGGALAVAGFLISPAAFFVARIGAVILAYQLFVIKLFSIFVVVVPISFHMPLTVILYYGILAIFLVYYYEDE